MLLGRDRAIRKILELRHQGKSVALSAAFGQPTEILISLIT